MEKHQLIQKIQQEPLRIIEWLGALTELEQKIISILYQKNQAMFVKKLQTELLKNTYYIQIGFEQKVDNFPFDPSLEILDDFLMEGQLKELNCVLSNDKNSEELNKHSFDTFLKIVDKKKSIQPPSQRRIRDICLGLNQINILNSRESPSKKTKNLFYLNPLLRSFLDDYKKQKNEK